MKFKVTGNRVLVKPVEPETISKGGIVLAENFKAEKPKRGTVLDVGEGKLLRDGSRAEMQVKVGDEVLFSTYAGTEVKINDQEYLIMDESDILAVLDGEGK